MTTLLVLAEATSRLAFAAVLLVAVLVPNVQLRLWKPSSKPPQEG